MTEKNDTEIVMSEPDGDPTTEAERRMWRAAVEAKGAAEDL